MKSIAELDAIRKKALNNMKVKKENQGYKIVIGMATCGIAAGAKPIMSAFIEQLEKRNISVPVSKTGCVGVCRLEPMADIIDDMGNKTTYIMLTPDKVEKIVQNHIINGQVVSEFTINSTQAIF
ncbi:MAG: (2Fe-2S) ferredoxin domain-containing protein [Clostridiales bacterium]|nr:(2Fe-2S) ferredoxin domain-containing protein [Clostridiales bacterium]